MIKALKNRLCNKKGFTLIEIIVVLVILAVLAAAAVPPMLGYIEEARGKAYAAEARVGYVAAQAAVTEILASEGTVVNNGTADGSVANYTPKGGTVAALTAHPSFANMTKDVTGGTTAFTTILVGTATGDENKVVKIIYKSAATAPYYQVTIEKDKPLAIQRVKS